MTRIPIHDVWRSLSQSIGGLFAGDHFFEPPTVRLDHKVWAIFLTVVSANTGGPTETVYTVMHTAYLPQVPFSLYVRPRSRRDDICPDGEAMSVGYARIDDSYLVCSSDPTKARSLLSYGDMADLLAGQQKTRLRIGSNLWHGVQDRRIPANQAEHFEEIEFRNKGVIRDTRTLKAQFDMTIMLLEQLRTFDLIQPEMPDLDAPLRAQYKRGGSWISRWGQVPIPDD